MFIKNQKIIIFILTIFLVFNISFFGKTQKVEATDNPIFEGLSDIASGISSVSKYYLQYKESILDYLAWAAADVMIERITASTIEWINTGFDGNPAYIDDLDSFLLDSSDNIVGRFILGDESFNSQLSFLCESFNVDVRLALLAGYTSEYDPGCTLSEIADNIGTAVGDLGDSLSETWNWDAWDEIMLKPNNNVFNAYIEASMQISGLSGKDKNKQTKQFDWGAGFKSLKSCEPIYDSEYPEVQIGENCKTTSPGAEIQNSLGESLQIGNRRLVVADEINEIIGAVLSQIFTQAMSSMTDEETGETTGGIRGLTEGDDSTISQLYSSASSTETQLEEDTEEANMEDDYNELYDSIDNELDSAEFEACDVTVIDSNEYGEYDGLSNDGNPIFRFQHPGGDYCDFKKGEDKICTVYVACDEDNNIQYEIGSPGPEGDYSYGEFLWKAESSSTGNLAILLPSDLSGAEYGTDDGFYRYNPISELGGSGIILCEFSPEITSCEGYTKSENLNEGKQVFYGGADNTSGSKIINCESVSGVNYEYDIIDGATLEDGVCEESLTEGYFD